MFETCSPAHYCGKASTCEGKRNKHQFPERQFTSIYKNYKYYINVSSDINRGPILLIYYLIPFS